MRAAGNLNVFELPPIERWSKAGGKVLVRRWSGPPGLIGPDTLAGTKAFQLKAAGVDYEIQKEPGQFSLISATYGADDTQPVNVPLSDEWHLDVNDLEKDIWEHPVIVAEIKKTFVAHGALNAFESAYAGAKALKDIKAMVAGETVEQDGIPVTLGDAMGAAVLAGISQTVLWSFIQELMKGAQIYNIDQFVLRRTRVVTESTAIKATSANDNVGRFFATASLKTLEGAPSTYPVVGDLPVGFWLKKRPKAERISVGKWQIIQEYWHVDSYSQLLFGLPL